MDALIALARRRGRRRGEERRTSNQKTRTQPVSVGSHEKSSNVNNFCYLGHAMVRQQITKKSCQTFYQNHLSDRHLTLTSLSRGFDPQTPPQTPPKSKIHPNPVHHITSHQIHILSHHVTLHRKMYPTTSRRTVSIHGDTLRSPVLHIFAYTPCPTLLWPYAKTSSRMAPGEKNNLLTSLRVLPLIVMSSNSATNATHAARDLSSASKSPVADTPSCRDTAYLHRPPA